MPYKTEKLESILVGKLGMEKLPKNDPHSWYRLIIPGLPTIMTKLPTNHREDVGDYLMSCIGRQLQVNLSKFKSIVDCKTSRNEYLELVKRHQ